MKAPSLVLEVLGALRASTTQKKKCASLKSILWFTTQNLSTCRALTRAAVQLSHRPCPLLEHMPMHRLMRIGPGHVSARRCSDVLSECSRFAFAAFAPAGSREKSDELSPLAGAGTQELVTVRRQLHAPEVRDSTAGRGGWKTSTQLRSTSDGRR